MFRDPVCMSVIYQYLRHTGSSLIKEFELKYKPDKNMEVDLEKLLGDWREEEEEIKMIIYKYLRKTSSPALAEEFRNTHLLFQKQQLGQNCVKETTFANLIQTWQKMHQDTFKTIYIDDDDSDGENDDISDDDDDDGDDDDVVILDDYDDNIVILDEEEDDLDILNDKHEEGGTKELKQLEASLVHQFLKLVSTELAVKFKETHDCQLEMPVVRLQDFAEKALKLNQPYHKENETGTNPKNEKRTSRLGMVSKGRFTEEEIKKIQELAKELGPRSASLGRRIWTGEEERKIEKVALEMNRFANHSVVLLCDCDLFRPLNSLKLKMSRLEVQGDAGVQRSGKFSKSESIRILEAMEEGLQFRNIAQILERDPEAVRQRMRRLKNNSNCFEKTRKFTTTEDLVIVGHMVPRLRSKQLNTSGFFDDKDFDLLGRELRRDVGSLRNRWEVTCQVLIIHCVLITFQMQGDTSTMASSALHWHHWVAGGVDVGKHGG